MPALAYASAADDLGGALEHAYRYLTQIRGEHAQAEAAALLDTPADGEDIQSSADQWISTLKAQGERALKFIDSIESMNLKYGRN